MNCILSCQVSSDRLHQIPHTHWHLSSKYGFLNMAKIFLEPHPDAGRHQHRMGSCPMYKPHPLTELPRSLFSCFCVILLTNQQTNHKLWLEEKSNDRWGNCNTLQQSPSLSHQQHIVFIRLTLLLCVFYGGLANCFLGLMYLKSIP